MPRKLEKSAVGKKNQVAMKNLKMKDVVELGGDEADYEMVQFDDDDESVELNSDSSSDNQNLQTEVKDLISTLGFGRKKNMKNDSEKNTVRKGKEMDEMKTSGKCSTELTTKAARQLQVETLGNKKKRKAQNDSDISNVKKRKETDQTKTSNKLSTVLTLKSTEQPQDAKLGNKKKRKAQDDESDESLLKETKKAKNKETSKKATAFQSDAKTPKKSHATSALDFSQKSRTYFLVKPGNWMDNQFLDDAVLSSSLSKQQVDQLEQFAKKLLDEEVALYRSKQDRKGPSSWMKKVLVSGTAADKMAALIVRVQDSPVHNLSSVDSLISMLKMKERRKSLKILDSVKKLFLTDLLPSRKLKPFHQQPLDRINELASGNKDTRDKRLLIWYFESQLKQKYENFIKAVEILGHDTIEPVKSKAIETIFDMLCEKPEQEKVLLSILVNKVGDPVRKMAARAVHLLLKLMDKHPNMKMIVTLEVERLLYRSNVTPKAQYYAICFLNGLHLNNNTQDSQLASHLVTIYFSFFKSFVAKGEIDSKMLSGLLAGVNRAYPFAKVDQQRIMEQSETLFRLIHVSNFTTSIQALMLLFQIVDISEASADRYYMALYSKLNDDEIASSAKLPLFLNLLLKSMKRDSVESRVQAFMKRLLQITVSSYLLDCGTLMLLSELLKDRPHLLHQTIETVDSDDEEEHFVDVKVEDDDDDNDNDDDDDDDENHDAEAAVNVAGNKRSCNLPTHVGSSWIHRQNLSNKRDNYDPTHRNPLFCRADKDGSRELFVLPRHLYPSVAVFANKILQGQSLDYTSNPLEDFSLQRYLHRGLTHNAKKMSGDVEEVLDDDMIQTDSDDDDVDDEDADIDD